MHFPALKCRLICMRVASNETRSHGPIQSIDAALLAMRRRLFWSELVVVCFLLGIRYMNSDILGVEFNKNCTTMDLTNGQHTAFCRPLVLF
jgi:hypothetical protein